MKLLSLLIDKLGTLIVMIGDLAAHLALIVKMVGRRIELHGLHSAYVYLRAHTNKILIERRNRNPNAAKVECPCCQWTGYQFLPLDGYGFWVPAEICPNCSGYERHRALHLYIHRHDKELLATHGLMLHYAPEEQIRDILQSNAALKILSSDLEPERLSDQAGTAFRSNILNIPVRDASVSVVFCLHLIEHVRDDTEAIAELERVMKPGAIGYIIVPIDFRLDTTEFFVTPHADICDHYWSYALDFKDKLSAFECNEIRPLSFLNKDEARRYGVTNQEVIYRVLKPVQ